MIPLSIKTFCAAALALSAAGVASAATKCQLGQLIELPVTMQGPRAIISARLDGMDAAFVADSGAFYSTMSLANAKKYGLSLTALFGFNIQGVTGDTEAEIGRAREFSFAGVSFNRVEFIVAGSEIGEGSAGVLGQNFFRLGDAEYDLANGAIRLMRPHDCGQAFLAYWAKPDQPYAVIPIEPTTPRSPHTRGEVVINGVRLRATFDTGASTSMLTRRAAERVGIKPDSPGVTPSGYAAGFGRRTVRSWIAPIASFKIGDEEARNTRLQFGDIELGDADMLVGVDFFLSHRVYVATSQNKLYLTYNGGRVFDLTPRGGVQPTAAIASIPGAAPPPEPGALPDAASYSRRGVAHVARGEFDAAIADLTRAVALAPTKPDYLVARAEARFGAHQPLLARADLDAALTLAPDDPRARVMRAEVELRDADKAPAIADLDAAARLGSIQDDVHLTVAGLYAAAEQPAAAIAQYDLWIAAHGADYRIPEARNGRCWARGLLGQELPRALDDCNAAVRGAPGASAAAVLDSRGLVFLRLGRLDKAIADYDAALRLNPRIAWSLYGRGVAELRSGQDARAAADFAAANAIAPDVARLAKRYGIAPDVK